MKTISKTTPLLLLLVCLLIIASCAKEPVLFLVGDSTMSFKPDPENPERGWGMSLPEYFDETLLIDNHAMNGRSTRSFIYEGRWDSVLNMMNKGDYVVVQFGHNDGSEYKIKRYCIPEEYRYNLTKFIKETREKSINLILCTSIQRRKFDSVGQLVNSHGVYPDIVRELAAEYQVPLVDMQKRSNELIMEYGIEGSKKLFLHFEPGDLPSLPEGRIDNTHFSELGANLMAGLFIQGLIDIDHELVEYLIKKPDEE